jgi:opacity protein-like surface antigen
MESNAWTRTISGNRVSFSVATVAGTYYPNPDQGFYMRAGLGGGSEKWASSSGSTSVNASQSGFGFTTGAGYEMRLTPHWSLGPALDFGYISVDQTGTKLSANYVNFTAAMNWYFF